jgi:predicted ATPase/DNA-binding CsgD family transcriptional regulator
MRVSRRLRVGNLPAEVSSFVGRRQEAAGARRTLVGSNLVTLTGPGGVGKSRLALRVAAESARRFPDGVWLVELAALSDPALLARAVAEALGLSDRSARDQAEVLAGYLAERRLLLLLDNCEHLVPACSALVAGLLKDAPDLRILATSREALAVRGETVIAVAPLAVPEPDEELGTEAAFRYPALMLFAERAAAACPGFEITSDNVDAVAALCRRLDGIPLALELAAARLRAMSVDQVVARLDDRFLLLTTGNRAGPPRHRTLRAAVRWSFDLCTGPERHVWTRASVFASRFEPAAVEQVCTAGEPAGDVPAALAGLVDKSLLIAEEDGGVRRYRMLDTVRRYGLDQLDDLAAARARHRDLHLELAERFHAAWFGPDQVEWSRRMRAALPDLRAALDFSLSTPDGARLGLRLAGALSYLWVGCGELREGRYWLERALAADPEPSRERARALAFHARILTLQGEPVGAIACAQECLDVGDRCGDLSYRSSALQVIGLSRVYGGDRAGLGLLEEAVGVAGRFGAAHPYLAFAKLTLALGVLLGGDPVSAADLCAQSEAICHKHGDRWWLANTLNIIVMTALASGDPRRADGSGRRALRIRQDLDDGWGAATALEYLAWVAAANGDHPRAARLLGAVDRLWREAGGTPFAGALAAGHDRCVAAAREGLGDVAFDVEYRRGGELTLAAAAAYALAPPRHRAAGVAQPAPGGGEASRLTPRETQIAGLLVDGLSNKQIADRLVISLRTAESHVGNILTKLGFDARGQIAVWYRSARS